ncbi:MAG TPA: co-chaperone DjlA [Pseudomonadales bacterium]|nr:co-chaperone DjlA [Pseudomonadales bacterium]
MPIPIPVLIAAAIGYLIGGPIGLVVLGVISWMVLRSPFVRMARDVVALQSRFLDSVFAVMGALCKADGVVTRDEIAVAETLFERMRLNPEARERAKAAFNRGKSPGFDLDAELAGFARHVGRNPGLLSMFMSIQLSAIAADGRIDPAERDLLVRVARGLGLDESEVARLEAMLSGGQADSNGPSLEDAYRVIGVDPSASDAEAKKAYRRLMNEHHPDKLAARGLPESMRELAEQRTVEIGAAWERIEAARRSAN